jgi:Predicted nucleotide-binding protein containing TIR-like domain
MNMPSVFVGSSREGIEIARAVQTQLAEVSNVDVWNEVPSRLSKGTLESLVEVLDTYDFAVLVLTPDDLIVSRGIEQKAARDNVLIELGLFMGRIGRQRTFLLVPKESNVKTPADLEGVAFATFATPDDPKRLLSAVGPACTQIRNAIKERTAIEQHLASELGIRITSPVNGQEVVGRFNLEGSYKTKPPPDFVVSVFEYSPATGRHYPRKEVDFDLERNTWKALSIEVGGERGTHRILKVVILKKENALTAYFDQLHYELRGMNPPLHILGFKVLSPDILQCASITVKRG